MSDDITVFDVPLRVTDSALEALPKAAKTFISQVLHAKSARVNKWSWYDIDWEFGGQLRSVRLCSHGSPSRDTSIVWVYNLDSTSYEAYKTQYHDPISLMKNQTPYIVSANFDDFLYRIYNSTESNTP